MKNTFKTTTRILAALALCAAVSACSQPSASTASGFPSYSPQAAVSSTFSAESIMDY